MSDEPSVASQRGPVRPSAAGVSGLARILNAALRFRLLLMAGAIVLLVIGGLTLRRMPTDPVGEVGSGPVLEVQTEALGLSSQEVEQYITVPLENNLLDGVMGTWDVRSQSLPGLSAVDLYFEPGVTTLHARQLVEERLTNAFSLPNVSSPPLLVQPLATSDRAIMIGLSSRSIDPLELSYLARWVVKPRLEGVSGVANVVIFGQRDRQLQVLVDPTRLAAAHVTLSQIIQTAGNAQLVSPLTYLEGAAPGTGGFLDGPNQRLEIRPVLPLGTPRDLAQAPVSGAPGRLPLGRVAQVVVSNQPLIGDAITRHGPGLVLLVERLPGASVRGVAGGVRRALGVLAPALRGVQVDTGISTPARYADSALSNVGLAALIAAGLVLLALGALLLDLGAVVVAAVSLATALVVAALVLDGLGYALSATAILGLLLGGLLVIDEVVGAVVDLRRTTAGTAGRPAPAAIRAALVPSRAPLAYATAIGLVTLVPVFVAHGLAATFVHPLLLALGLAAVAGMAVTLTLTPALAWIVLGRGPRRRAPGRGGARYVALVRRLGVLPPAVPFALCVAGLVAIVVLPFLREPGTPAFRDRDLIVELTGPAGISLPEMDRISGRTLSALRALPGVDGASATIGRAVAGDRLVDTGSAELYVDVGDGADLPGVERAVRAVVDTVPGFAATVTDAEAQALTGVLSPAHPNVTVRVYGEDPGIVAGLAARVAGRLSHVSGLGRPQISRAVQEPNIEVRVNDTAALRAGVLPGDARRQVSTLVSGLTVGNFFQDQAVFDVVVRGTPAVRSSVAAIGALPIDTQGGSVPLSRIASVSIAPDPIDIRHQALSRYADVIVPRTGLGTGAASAAAERAIKAQSYPLGYRAEVLGGTPEDSTGHAALLSYVLAAAIGIILLLQAALRSWQLAAVVFLTLPLSLIGGLIVALAAGWLASLGTAAGLLTVYLLAARHAVALTGEVRRRQAADGEPLAIHHVLGAAQARLGPVIGSCLVLAVALLPFLVLGDQPGGELPHVAAGVVLGGLLSTALLVLIGLPAACLTLLRAELPPAAEELVEPVPEAEPDLILAQT